MRLSGLGSSAGHIAVLGAVLGSASHYPNKVSAMATDSTCMWLELNAQACTLRVSSMTCQPTELILPRLCVYTCAKDMLRHVYRRPVRLVVPPCMQRRRSIRATHAAVRSTGRLGLGIHIGSGLIIWPIASVWHRMCSPHAAGARVRG